MKIQFQLLSFYHIYSQPSSVYLLPSNSNIPRQEKYRISNTSFYGWVICQAILNSSDPDHHCSQGRSWLVLSTFGIIKWILWTHKISQKPINILWFFVGFNGFWNPQIFLRVTSIFMGFHELCCEILWVCVGYKYFLLGLSNLYFSNPQKRQNAKNKPIKTHKNYLGGLAPIFPWFWAENRSKRRFSSSFDYLQIERADWRRLIVAFL